MSDFHNPTSLEYGAFVIRKLIENLPVNGHVNRLDITYRKIAEAVDACPADRKERIAAFEAATSSLPNWQEIHDAVNNADPSEDMDEHGGPASDNPVSSHPLGEDVPPLPAYARLDEEQEYQAHSVGDWLDLYEDFASKASPMTPASFHRAVGLFTGSLAIARRLCLRVSISQNTIYPNLYLLFIGQSTRPRKTTGLRVNNQYLRQK